MKPTRPGNPRGFIKIRLLLSCILGALVLSFAGLTAWFLNAGVCGESNSRSAEMEIKNLEQMVGSFYITSTPHRLPDTLEEMTEGPSPLTKSIPKDPWGNEFIYIRNSETDFEILSGGPDGVIPNRRN